MKIERILTNNALIVLDDEGKEQVVCGKGIGFKKRIGDVINMELIEKTFVLSRGKITKQLEQLLCDIPMDYIEVSNKIVNFAKVELGKSLNDSLLISLSDHLYASIQRFKDGINISNGLLWEIQQFYEVEFEVGCRALNVIEDMLQIRLPEAEAAYIALHFVNAESDNSSLEEVYKVTKMIQDITSIVKYHFGIEFDTKSAYYYRFITHIKFFARRLFENSQYSEEEEDINFLNVVKANYDSSYLCMCKINKYLKSKFNYELKDEEKLYLTIHIQRVVYRKIKK